MKLSSITHDLAKRALCGEWSSALTDINLSAEFFEELSKLPEPLAYSRCVEYIAEHCPVRLVPGELVAGSATLAAATKHVLPLLNECDAVYGSTSHVTLGFDRVLRSGYKGLREQIQERLDSGDLDQQGIYLLHAMLECLNAARLWQLRYVDLIDKLSQDTDQQGNYQILPDTLMQVPENPPRNFREAVQALWSAFCFQHLCGNWPGIGRIDWMLGPYLERDLASGTITLDQARELIAHFWIKGAEWAGTPWAFGGSGDAQYYQNIILAGVDEYGNEVTNAVTYLVLDVVEELGISDYPIAVRLNEQSPEKLIRRVAQLQRLGGGIVSVYNENVVIAALQKIGISLPEARKYTNDGCWEPQIPGETCFIYQSFDILRVLQDTIGVTSESVAEFGNFDSLYNQFRTDLRKSLEPFHEFADSYPNNCNPKGQCVLASLLTDRCIETGRGYYESGAKYNIISAHAGGIPDAANSLVVIRELVYNRKLLTLAQLVDILRDNWEDHEDLRQQVVHEFDYYGNDNMESDSVARQVLDDFVEAVDSVPYRNGVYRTPGVSTFGREIGWRHSRGATAAGSRRGEILACNFSPTPGTDTSGPTAALMSFCKMGLERLTGGAAMELKFHPSAVEGEAGLDALVNLLKVFVQIGGFYMQVDSVSRETLLEAQRDPAKHAGLAVRVSGWSARFVTLSDEWQQMIIDRTEQI